MGAGRAVSGFATASAFFTAKEAGGKKELNPTHPWRKLS